MKIFQVAYDTIFLTVLAKDEAELFDILQEESDDYVVKDDELFYYFGNDEDSAVKCFIQEIPMMRGIIHSESH